MTIIEGCHALRIEPDHPSFTGHFPGNPIVPGALLLLRLQKLIEEHSSGWQLTTINSVKFLAPILPGETLEVDCQPSQKSRPEVTRLLLRVTRKQQLVGEATFSMRPVNTEES